MDRSKNKLLTCFRKAYSTQHVQFCLLQRWQQELDNFGIIGTLSMNLYKAYDWLLIDLIVKEFEAYALYKTQKWSQLALSLINFTKTTHSSKLTLQLLLLVSPF